MKPAWVPAEEFKFSCRIVICRLYSFCMVTQIKFLTRTQLRAPHAEEHGSWKTSSPADFAGGVKTAARVTWVRDV